MCELVLRHLVEELLQSLMLASHLVAADDLAGF
jgi:hypothetical protein